MSQEYEAPSLAEQISALWPIASTTAAGVVAWFTANWRARRITEAKTAEVVEKLRERAHQTEMELGQIRAVLSAATGLKFEQITLSMVQEMVHRQSVTVQELETFILTMPRLMWIKRREGEGVYRMVQVSQVYADKYLGGSASLYTGKTDAEVWPAEVAAIFAENDERAYVADDVVEIDERVFSVLTGSRGRFVGVKWCFRLGQETYVCGLGVHKNKGEE